MLSPAGRGVLAAGVVLSGLGWGLGYAEAVVLGVACLLATVLAVAWTWGRPVAAADRQVVPGKVARGDAAEGVVVLTNTGGRVLRGLRAEDRVDGVAVLPVNLPPVPPGGQVRGRYPLPTHRRGRIEIGPLHLVRADPLGLARRARGHGDTETLVVRPRVVPLPVLPAGRTHHLEGPAFDTAEDGTLTFHSLREYVLGDDLRQVHWRSTARTGTVMVRRMIDVSLPLTTVVLDTGSDAYHDDEDFEVAVDAAASVAAAAARSGFPVRVVTGAGPLRVAAHDPGPEPLLDLLALVRAEPAHGLDDALGILERTRDGDTLVVVTGTARPATERLERVRRRFARVALVRVGPAGAAERAPGTTAIPQLRVTDLDEFARAWRAEVLR